MQIVTDVNGTEEQKFICVGETIRIPIRQNSTHPPMILDVIDSVKSLSSVEHEAIIRDGGIEVPPGVDPRDLLYFSMSFVQNAWYEAQPSDGSAEDIDRRKKVADGHAARAVKFAKAVEKAIKNPPTAAEAKAPKAPREPKAPKAAKAPKEPTTARIATRLYSVNPNGDVAVIAGFKGFRKDIYETVAAAGAGAQLTFEQVLQQTKDRPGTKPFTGSDGGNSQAAYQLKELVAMRVVFLEAGTQAPTNEVAAAALATNATV